MAPIELIQETDCEHFLTEHRLELNGIFYESCVNHATQLKTCKNTSFALNGTLGTIKGTYTDGTLFLGKVLVGGKALLMVSGSQPEVKYFVTQHVVKRSLVPHKRECVSAVVTVN